MNLSRLRNCVRYLAVAILMTVSSQKAYADTASVNATSAAKSSSEQMLSAATPEPLPLEDILHWSLLGSGAVSMLSGIGLSLYHMQLVDEIKRDRGEGPADADLFKALQEPSPWYLASVVTFVLGTAAAAAGLGLMGASE